MTPRDTPAPDSPRDSRGIAAISGNFLLTVNGKKLQSGTVGADEFFGAFFDNVTLPAAPSTVAFRLRANRTGALFPLSTAVSDTWTWRSGTGLSNGLPSGWFCADGSNRCEVEPLLTFGYQVAGIALDGTTAAGAPAGGADRRATRRW